MEREMRITSICVNILEDKSDKVKSSVLEELSSLLDQPLINLTIGPQKSSCTTSSLVIIALFKFAKKRKAQTKWPECERILSAQIIRNLYQNNSIQDIKLYYTITAYLLDEMGAGGSEIDERISEEYMISLLESLCSATNAVSWDILVELYDKSNAPKLSLTISHILTIAKKEKYRKLRILAMKTLMCMARVLKDEELYDYELSDMVASVFMFYLPNIAVVLKNIATGDEKAGHAVISTALKAWSRIVMITTRDYRSADDKLNILMDYIEIDEERITNVKFGSIEEMSKYIEKNKRTPGWYRHTDEKLHKVAEEFVLVTNFDHHLIRQELIDMCSILTSNCNNTIPKTLGPLIQIIIILTEDEDEKVKRKACKLLTNLTQKMNNNAIRLVLETSEENFYQFMLKLPRIFNSFDSKTQCRSLHLLLGYLHLFGKEKLMHMLHSSAYLNSFLTALIQISELDKCLITSLEDYNLTDLQENIIMKSNSWRNFHYFREESIVQRLIAICGVLSQPSVIDIITDFLIDLFCNEPDRRKEVTFLLNETVSSEIAAYTNKERLNRLQTIKQLINLYLDPTYWNLSIDPNEKEFGIRHTLGEIQNNILQICLQLDGIGKMALIYKSDFNDMLLKTLYPVLEKIGSGNVFLKDCGLQALSNIARACGHASVTELINKNSDYFSFYIVRNLKAIEKNRSVLNVFAVVMKYSSIDVLPYISDIADGLLMDSCDLLYKDPNSFLRFFQIFISCLNRWLKIEPLEVPIKSVREKERESKEFQLNDIREYSDFSDDTVMEGKTAAEVYKEDMMKKEDEIEEEMYPEVEEYKKPEAPTHIKLTASILKKTLNYLPSKNKSSKLLSLDILTRAVELLRDNEDELLPVVHLIWSPLVERFKELDEPLIINLSFRLLETLARLSKDFIRSRTSKDVLPQLLNILVNLSKESYLKDKGAVYRYTQAYKLQETLTKDLSRVLCLLDCGEEDFLKSSSAMVLYLSDKQPQPLQENAVEFYRIVKKYDERISENLIRQVDETAKNNNECEMNLLKIMIN